MMLAFTTLSFLSLLLSSVLAQQEVTFRNELAEDVELYWEGEDENRILQGTITKQGGELSLQTFPHHVFSYHHNGETNLVEILDKQTFVVLLGKLDSFQVRCTTTTEGNTLKGQILDILVHPSWSPRGASRFLELIRQHYYDGVALNRVVPKFLTQFGISADYAQRTEFREKTIMDDNVEPKIPFQRGMLSYAGSGPDSRTTEIFVVMPDTPQSQLDYFGNSPWETPFAIVKGAVEESPLASWYSYGDMPPWGEGPDPQEIYKEDGYEYLKREFPRMDYIETCVIVEGDDEADVEL